MSDGPTHNHWPRSARRPPGACSGCDAERAEQRRPITDIGPHVTGMVIDAYMEGGWLERVKAEVWDEGHRDVCTDCCCPPDINPYRAS